MRYDRVRRRQRKQILFFFSSTSFEGSFRYMFCQRRWRSTRSYGGLDGWDHSKVRQPFLETCLKEYICNKEEEEEEQVVNIVVGCERGRIVFYINSVIETILWCDLRRLRFLTQAKPGPDRPTAAGNKQAIGSWVVGFYLLQGIFFSSSFSLTLLLGY